MDIKKLLKAKPKNDEQETEEKTKKNSNIKRIIYFVLFGIFSAIFIFSAIYLMDYLITSRKNINTYNDLSDGKTQIQDMLSSMPTSPNGSLIYDPDSTYPFDPNSPILPEYQSAYALNNDLVGWISIDGTAINYPVMHHPEEKDYYLHRNFFKEYASRGPGTLYIREQCDPIKPSDNLVIYGHHMRDGTMFHNLHHYYEKSFWQEHQFIQYDSIYERHTYQIVGVFKTDVVADDFFPYHRFNDAKNEEEFDEFIDTVKRLSFYDTGVDAEYGDMLITLSTCEYTLTEGRLVVVAKRIS